MIMSREERGVGRRQDICYFHNDLVLLLHNLILPIYDRILFNDTNTSTSWRFEITLYLFIFFSIEISHLASDDPGDIIIDDDNCEEIKTIISYN